MHPVPAAVPLYPDLMPWARIVYSSRTGNTRKLAQRLADVFGLEATETACETDARRAERGLDGRLPGGDMAGYGDELLLLGFWTWRGGPDPAMRDFMRGLRARRVFVFGTMAAWPDSQHAKNCLKEIRFMLEQGGNTLLGHFFCQGRLDPALRARSTHPRTPERTQRLDEAEKHPDEADLAALEKAARAVLDALKP